MHMHGGCTASAKVFPIIIASHDQKHAQVTAYSLIILFPRHFLCLFPYVQEVHLLSKGVLLQCHTARLIGDCNHWILCHLEASSRLDCVASPCLFLLKPQVFHWWWI